MSFTAGGAGRSAVTGGFVTLGPTSCAPVKAANSTAATAASVFVRPGRIAASGAVLVPGARGGGGVSASSRDADISARAEISAGGARHSDKKASYSPSSEERMPIQLNSTGWRIRPARMARGRGRDGGDDLPGLPREFLTV